MKLYKLTYPAYPNEEVTRIELSPEIFEKIVLKINLFLQIHKQAWNIHRNDDERQPVIGKGIRLHNIENGNVRQFNMHYWFRPRNMHFYHGMEEIGEVVFFYSKPADTDPQNLGEVDHYTLYKGNIITHQHQDLIPKLYNGVNRSMWEKPDLDDQTATMLLRRIENILEEEKNRRNLIEAKDNLE